MLVSSKKQGVGAGPEGPSPGKPRVLSKHLLEAKIVTMGLGALARAGPTHPRSIGNPIRLRIGPGTS